MRVLITGSSGMIGRHLSYYLKDKGYDVITTDIFGSEVDGDISDKDFVFSKLTQLDFDSVVHLAAITDIKKTILDPYNCFLVNCLGTLNILELALRKNVSRFIYASSANVYGIPKRNPVSEEDQFSPRVPYDYSKVASEFLVKSYYETKKLPCTVTRSWLLFGEYDNPNRATIRFIMSCLKNESITLYNGGRDVTAPSHAVNYSKLVYLILNNDVSIGQAYNFGGEKVISIKEYAELIKKIINSDSEIITAPPRSEMEKEPLVSYPSTEKIKKQLNYTYEITLEEGIKRTSDWVKDSLI